MNSAGQGELEGVSGRREEDKIESGRKGEPGSGWREEDRIESRSKGELEKLSGWGEKTAG